MAQSGEVIAEPSVVVPNENLPPVGPLQRWELASNEMVYSMKYSLFARWVQAQVIEVDRREPKASNFPSFTSSFGLSALQFFFFFFY